MMNENLKAVFAALRKIDNMDDLRAINALVVEKLKMNRAVNVAEKRAVLKLRAGQTVKFRRNANEAFAIGVVEKVNRVKVAVKITKGNGRAIVGSRWNVPITMLEAA